jgi:hypothetical protein
MGVAFHRRWQRRAIYKAAWFAVILDSAEQSNLKLGGLSRQPKAGVDMGWLPALCATIAALLFKGMGYGWPFWVSVAVGISSFWSYGVMHNFAYGASLRRRQELMQEMVQDGADIDQIEMIRNMGIEISEEDAQSAPNWATYIAMAAAIVAVVLFIWALVGLYGQYDELMRIHRLRLATGQVQISMPWWLNWSALLVCAFLVFFLFSWVPTQKLDPYWRWSNPVGRPCLNTLVITGGPAVFAKLTGTPSPWLLVPLCFLMTQYAVLTGRFLEEEKVTAGRTMLVTTILIWIVFWTV